MKDGLSDQNRGKVRGQRKEGGVSSQGGLKVNIGVKVDDQLWRRLRSLAIRQGRLTGELLDAAIEGYLGKHGG
jgi:hypothetical protein